MREAAMRRGRGRRPSEANFMVEMGRLRAWLVSYPYPSQETVDKFFTSSLYRATWKRSRPATPLETHCYKHSGMYTARITKGHSSRPGTVVLRLDKEALAEIGTRIVLDRARMTIRPATLDERMHLTLNRKTRATTIQVPHTSSADEWIGDYWVRGNKDGTHFQLLRDELETEDLEFL